MRLVYLDAGTRDEWALDLAARVLAARMRAFGITVEHEEFDDGHMNTGYRALVSLPKLAAALSAPARDSDRTSPDIGRAVKPGPEAGTEVRIAVTDLDHEGAGVGSLAPPATPRGRGGVTATVLDVHVPGALPGDEISAHIDHVSTHRPIAWARLRTIHRASPDRVPHLPRARPLWRLRAATL